MKQHIIQALIGVALALTLLTGAALPSGEAMTHTIPTHHLLVCGGVPAAPPCI